MFQVRLSPRAPGLAVDENGLLTRVPAGGLSAVDGPEVLLRPDFAEWYGVEFTEEAARREASASGVRADWGARPPVTPLGFAAGEGWARARAAAGPLEIETLAELEGEKLFFTVTLTNRGPASLGGIFYSREWSLPGEPGWTFPPDLAMARVPPGDVRRRLWMLDDLEPGASGGLVFSFQPGPPHSTLGAVEVPLVLYRNEDWPDGVPVGATNGISFGDFDADGWTDVFACQSARLLRNVGGTTWELAADLDAFLPAAFTRYGSSFGDYDVDGLPDIGTEPRTGAGDSCLNLLHNLGDALFVNIATDPALFIDQPCGAPSETICWGDVEEDGDLDLFLPVYPPSAGGPGNFFMENLGPTGPLGAYRLIEHSTEAGLNNPPQTARPEGAQFVDADGDGDMDLYSNGVLYQNQSEETPAFAAMQTEGSGIGLRSALDEGAAFFDYDLDGDQDLFIVYSQRGTRFWEARGDGTFFQGEGGIIDEPRIGLDLGLSAEDWDNDGDVDFTTRQVFRRNRFVEDGARHFTVATHSIPGQHITSATPAWGDWDRDGDLDCALGNWQSIGHLYENVLWDELPEDLKPYVRVRVVCDDPDVPRGLETEYGATVELVLHGEAHRRVKFVASGHGYLNQNEYVLHFALPPGPDGEAPLEALVFDLAVDLPSRASRGVLRVDRHVNPALGDVVLADLADREITVFRSGRVVLDGVERAPVEDGLSPRMFATGGGLARPDPLLGLPEPEPAGGGERWVGIELVAPPAGQPVLVKELELDGQLAAPLPGSGFNLALWDVTDPLHPRRVLAETRSTQPRNRRTRFPFVVALRPAHVYRCVARVGELRATPFDGTPDASGLAVKGGLDYLDSNPATGKGVVLASRDPARMFLALRYVTAEKDVRQR